LGRWHGEEQGIIKGAADAGHPLKAVILLNIPEEMVHERWGALHAHIDKRGLRADDAHASLEIRLREFAKKTVPVIEFYREKDMLIEIDGSLPPEQVETQIIDKLYEFATKS
jgi:adenylate kinase family enzyme